MGMLDIIFIVIVILFFAISLWYLRFCERL
jgi:hypothetical protein